METTNVAADKRALVLVAKDPQPIKAALNGWAEASDRVNSDPLQLEEAPAWVMKAWVEVVKVVMPGRRLPTSGECTVELLGEVWGRLQSLTKLFSGEIPMGPEMTEELRKLEELAASQPQLAERAVEAFEQELQNRMDATNQSLPKIIEATLGSSHEDAVAFQKGLLRGMTLAPDELTTPKTFQRHTRTYFVLARLWRAWIKCKSLCEVHGHLCTACGERRIGNFRTFEKLCEKIGFKLRGRGRPRKAK